MKESLLLLVGKRILLAEKGLYNGPSKVAEFKILEVSPSGKFVKVMDHFGTKYWKNSIDITPIEVLESAEDHPEKSKNETT